MRQRHHAHGQPRPTVGREGKRRDLVVHQIAIFTVPDMEVIAHETATALVDGFIIESLEAHFVDLGQHGLFLGWYMVDIQAVAHLLHLLGSMTAQEQWIARHVQETLPEVVDDVYTLVSGIGHRINGAYHGIEMLVSIVINTLNTIDQRKKVFNFSHIGFQVYDSANISQMLHPYKWCNLKSLIIKKS